MNKKNDGFTLVEIIIVIAIIGILAAVTVPNFIKLLPNWRVKSATTDLFSNMQMAKMTAIKRGLNCSITFSTAPHQYQIVVTNLNGTTTALRTVALSEYKSGVQFLGPDPEQRTFDVSPLTFNSRGMLTTNDGYGYISASDLSTTEKQYYRAGVTTAGVVKMQRYESGEDQWK